MKANEFDKKIKDQVKKVEHTAPANVSWDINKSWDKLSQLLKQTSPKSLIWYFSLAASVSMVMANVTLMDYDWEDQLPIPSAPVDSNSSNLIVFLANHSADELTSSPPSTLFTFIDAKSVKSLSAINSQHARAKFIPLQLSSSEPADQKEKVSFRPQFNTGIGTEGFRLSGELMVVTNKKIKNALLGMSLEMSSQHFTHINQEMALASHSRQALYMNMVVLNDKAKRPWSARIGTPLWQTNPADSTAPMIKMNYQTKVGKRVFIGPEVIFSKGFKQVYPGISLSFG